MKAHRGFTLLELLLALAISALVLTALGMAIDLQLRVVEAGRVEVEQAQLARALLRRIGDDLRSTVLYAPVDVESLVPATSASSLTNALGGMTTSGASSGSSSGSSQGSSSGSGSSSGRSSSGGGSSSSGGGSGVTQATSAQSASSASGGTKSATSAGSASSGGAASGGSSAGSSAGAQSSAGTSGGGASGSMAGGASGSSSGSTTATGTETDSNSDVAESSVVPVVPGLYGNPFEMQVDVSRLPRIDQYQQMGVNSDGTPGDKVSDVKTVAYYVVNAASAPLQAGAGAGLMRRTLDRAATAWANTQGGGTNDLMRNVEALAPEVTAIEFRYFDGTEWIDTWDSAERAGVPVAVEVALKMAAVQPASTFSFLSLGGANDAAVTERVYRLTVNLPTAQPTTLDAASSSTEEISTSTSSTSESP